jgi:formamidopyrimidine-DNA glycosylase
MPELPEVETIRRDLEPRLAGRRIARVEIALDRVPVLEGIDEATFREGLVGARIEGLDRRGKFLIFELDTGARLIVHLRMTGKLLLDGAPLVGHLRATFTLDDGTTLRFTDMRKFGRLWLVDSLTPLFDKIGPEPLTEGFALEHLAAALLNRKAPVKSVILDQRRIAGIGNIYADEALHRAGIHPSRPADRISDDELAALHRAIRATLTHALQYIVRHPDAHGRPFIVDAYDDRMRLPRKKNAKCPDCGTLLATQKFGGRTSYFCPQCQK